MKQTLYDYLDNISFESVEIKDKDYNTKLNYYINIEEADNDPYQEFLVRLAKCLTVVSVNNKYVTVNLAEILDSNEELLEELFDMNMIDYFTVTECVLDNLIELIIGGYCTTDGYRTLNKRFKFYPTQSLLTKKKTVESVSKDDRYITIQLKLSDPDKNILHLLECIKGYSKAGHSFKVSVDPDDEEFKKDFYIDGDGCDQILDINNTGKED